VLESNKGDEELDPEGSKFVFKVTELESDGALVPSKDMLEDIEETNVVEAT